MLDVPQALQLGVTHTQVSADNWKPAESRARADAIMREVTDYGNQHIMGWGALNPSPSPGVRDWSSLDQRMQLIADSGVTPVITLCCAPDWMKGGKPGETDWSRLEVAPDPAHFADFAELAADVAKRYPQVKHFIVWNELKGFHDDSTNKWDIRSYTEMYNLVYSALKAVDPTIQVGGPYVPMDSWSDANISDPSAMRGPWGVMDQRALDAVTYWLANADGADFIAVDGSNSTNDADLITSPQESNEKFAVITRWLATVTPLPIWWAELYPDTAPDVSWSSPYRADVAIDAILRIGDAGGAVVLLWQPEGDPSFPSVGLWDSTAKASGGQPQPVVERLAWLRESWSQGDTIDHRWEGDSLVLTRVPVPGE
jgi:hypothetical protein